MNYAKALQYQEAAAALAALAQFWMSQEAAHHQHMAREYQEAAAHWASMARIQLDIA
jgi:hypothetical protein